MRIQRGQAVALHKFNPFRDLMGGGVLAGQRQGIGRDVQRDDGGRGTFLRQGNSKAAGAGAEIQHAGRGGVRQVGRAGTASRIRRAIRFRAGE